MIKLFLDMDGVICDFDSKYAELLPELPDSDRFKHAVLDHKIFTLLKPMPDAKELLDYVACLRHIDIQILTSVGTFDEQRGYEAKIQKRSWLDRNNIFYQTNFVRTKSEKADFANSSSILIDDSPGCINPFVKKGGYGILHVDTKTTIIELEKIFKKIKMTNAYTT
jgi:hypothetical protein